MAQSKIKIKIVRFTNNLLEGKPVQYKCALQTPAVVSTEKFIENITKETGLSRFQAEHTLACIFQTAGDYMELGNAVQLHENFGTLKPYLKVKAVNTKDEARAETIQGMGLRLIPTGKMRDILAGSQFTISGLSSGGDVEDSEVMPPEGGEGGGSLG